jgi:histidinol dehydrogenase
MPNRKNGIMNTICFPPRESWDSLLARPVQAYEEVEELVKEVFEKVRSGGDQAITAYTRKFDGVNPGKLQVMASDLADAEKQLSPELCLAIQKAKHNIELFHLAQRTEKVQVETGPGIQCWQEKRPIEKVGLYIPGGTAPLFSTVLMLAIPASIAGCREVVLCSPPGKDGSIHPAILYTAQLCGVRKIYAVGGIQAIAGMTFGTESIPKVYKIFGPGNQYVTVAKQVATTHGVAIDMPAGPSELLVAADDSADPAFVASDLLSQAEHGADSQVIFVTTSRDMISKVEKEVNSQLQFLPRKAIAEKAIANSKMLLVKDDITAIDLINSYAPEHFIVCCRNEAFYLERLQNAGSVFIGNYTPESAGDYASGTNHTLPTNGYARQYSGVNLDSYMKSITFQRITENGIRDLGPTIELMAAAEGLQAHKNAVSLRLRRLEEKPNKDPGKALNNG